MFCLKSNGRTLCVLGRTHHCLSDVHGFLFGNIFVPAVMPFLFLLLLLAVLKFDLSSVYCYALKTLKIATQNLSCDQIISFCFYSLDKTESTESKSYGDF